MKPFKDEIGIPALKSNPPDQNIFHSECNSEGISHTVWLNIMSMNVFGGELSQREGRKSRIINLQELIS